MLVLSSVVVVFLFPGLTSTLSFRYLVPPIPERPRWLKVSQVLLLPLLLASGSSILGSLKFFTVGHLLSHTQNLVAVVSFPFLHANKALKIFLYDCFQWSLR